MLRIRRSSYTARMTDSGAALAQSPVPMERADAILAAVQAIHEAPFALDGWLRALSAVAAAVDSQHGVLLVQSARRKTEFFTGFGMTSEQAAGFAAAAAKGDSRYWKAIHALPAGTVLPNSALVPEGEFSRSVLYNEGIRPTGAFHGMIAAPLGNSFPRSIYVATGRDCGCDDFDSENITTMRTLLPHFVTALQTCERIAASDLHAKVAEDALDRLHVGVILVDSAARILFANRVAEIILGSDLHLNGEGLCLLNQSTTATLHRLIASCADTTIVSGRPGGSMDIPREHGGPLHVTIAPFRAESAQIDTAWLGATRPVAIITITDRDRQRRLQNDDLCLRFGLTPAEAEVALEILKGDGRDAAAARLGIATATVRAHLSRIFDKAGVRRQAELVRLLSR